MVKRQTDKNVVQRRLFRLGKDSLLVFWIALRQLGTERLKGIELQ